MDSTLENICKKHGCVYASFFPYKDGILKSEPYKDYFAANDKAKKFQFRSQYSTFKKGVGDIGKAFATGQPVWQSNVSMLTPSYYFRQNVAATNGIKACGSIPYKQDRKLVGVVEFCWAEESEEKVDFVKDAMQQFGN